MSTVVNLVGGIGINGLYHVRRNDALVAFIERDANRGWYLRSIHYHERLKHFPDIDAARRGAVEFATYPTESEVYETIAQRIRGWRRQWMRTYMADRLAQAAADLANGSNTAHDRLVEMAREIETYANDRTDIGNVQYLDGRHFMNDGGLYLGQSPVYPKPPKEKASDAARRVAQDHSRLS